MILDHDYLPLPLADKGQAPATGKKKAKANQRG